MSDCVWEAEKNKEKNVEKNIVYAKKYKNLLKLKKEKNEVKWKDVVLNREIKNLKNFPGKLKGIIKRKFCENV